MDDIQYEIQEAERLLLALEDGNLNADDAFIIAEKRDPVLVYFVVKYLRDKYPPGSTHAEAVSKRILLFVETSNSVVKAIREGEKDSMREWFDETYVMRDYFADHKEYLQLIVNKLEG